MPARPIVIAGGSGFLGTNLARHLTALGESVVVISRSKPKGELAWDWVPWDGHSVGDWARVLEGAKALVNLAGRTVDCVKTPDHCDEILRSRVEATRVLGRAMRGVEQPPAVWVQMSTAHIVGDPPERICDEDAPAGYGLAPLVGLNWEAAFQEALLPGVRPVILRTSFVLGRGGGALPTLAALTRFGLGGRAGHGRQGISWIHEHDMDRLFERAIREEGMRGVYMATAPNPVSNDTFMACLRETLGMPLGLPSMEWMVRIGARWMLNTDPELVLYGRYCVSRRLREEGFEFRFGRLEAALVDLLGAELPAAR